MGCCKTDSFQQMESSYLFFFFDAVVEIYTSRIHKDVTVCHWVGAEA